jgi:hypothetical protein
MARAARWCRTGVTGAGQWVDRRSGAGSTPFSTDLTCIRVELGSGAGKIDLHWPLSHARDLAAWLREFIR